MNGQTTIMSHERFKLDELEVHFYGISSTQIYIQYREMVDKEIKLTMLKIAKHFEKNTKNNPDFITRILGEEYLEFYAKAEQHFQTIYQDIQNILKLPDNVLLNHKSLTAAETLHTSEVNILEEEIRQLQERFIIETYYLEILKQKEMLINNINLTLKEKVKTQNIRQKYIKDSSKVSQVMDEKMKKLAADISKDDIKMAINSNIELIDNN